MERRPAALFAPAIAMKPPGNSFSSVVLASSRERLSLTLARSTGDSWIIGDSRCRLYRLAMSMVGCTIITGPGLMSAR